jgi:two-component system alkaline phosphatase synthesis response regulator PhoP
MKAIPKKVLIVEDNQDIRRMYQTKLTAEGFAVETAGDGDSGYEIAKRFQPDVVLLDIMMPEVTGIDFLTYLRHQSKNDCIKVIVLTNLGDLALEDSLHDIVSDYVVKTDITPSELVARINTVLAN